MLTLFNYILLNNTPPVYFWEMDLEMKVLFKNL